MWKKEIFSAEERAREKQLSDLVAFEKAPKL